MKKVLFILCLTVFSNISKGLSIAVITGSVGDVYILLRKRYCNCKLVAIGFVVLLAMTSCSAPEIVEEDNREDFEQVEQSYLEKHNTPFEIYQGTNEYNRLISLTGRINYEVIFRSDLFDSKIARSGWDSVAFKLEHDTLSISHILTVRGSCLHFLPYLKGEKGKFVLKSPEVVEGIVEVEGKDTSIATLGCALENVVEIKYKIPLSVIGRDWSLLIFRNKRITPADLN